MCICYFGLWVTKRFDEFRTVAIERNQAARRGARRVSE
jgi:hypothetical protein